MTEEQAQALYPLITTLRQLFHKLGAAADTLHQDLGITAGMRAILESLASLGPQTVPQMAKARPVSRQHIQGLVNALAEQGLVEIKENPAHRRSHLIVLSLPGLAAFRTMKTREAAAFAVLPFNASPEAIKGAHSLLLDVLQSVESFPWHEQQTGAQTP